MECLSRLNKSKGVKYETIVVDNASTDGSAQAILKTFPDVKLVESKVNLGFAGGNNLGMKMAKGEKLILLNSDCFVNPDTLANLPDLDVVGCKLLNKDGSVQQSWGYFPTLRRITQMMFFVDNFPIIRKFIDSIHVRDVSRYQTQHEVDWVTGAFVMVRRIIFETVGGIDEKYFMYGEEMEWMYRIKKAGFKIWYSPEPLATHLLGASSSNRAPAVVGEIKGWMYWFAKHNPVWQQKLLPLVILIGCLLRVVLKPAMSKYYLQTISEIFAPSRKRVP